MLFTLDAIFAREGDSLLLHYGPPDDPQWILIDGGSRGCYKAFVQPRIAQVREFHGFDEDEKFPLEALMVSHVDADHISGVLDLVNEMDDDKRRHQPVMYDVKTLWHNSFDDILDNEGDEIVSHLADEIESGASSVDLSSISGRSQAVVESVKQGRDLRNLATRLKIAFNKPFEGLVIAPDNKKRQIPFDHGLTLTILGPLQHRVEEYQKAWKKDLKKILAEEAKEAEAQAFKDDSAFNLASIAVLAEMDGKSMLLTGDARGDYIIEALLAYGMLANANDTLHVDLLKLPHHGSEHNVDLNFFKQITADIYVISANGRHDNPDPATLDLIAEARGDDEYALYLTFEAKAFENVPKRSKSRREALKKIHDWLTDERPPNCKVVYRKPGADIVSTPIDLADPLDLT